MTPPRPPFAARHRIPFWAGFAFGLMFAAAVFSAVG